MNTGFQFQPQDPDRSTRVPSDSQEFASKSLRDLHAEISNLRLARIMLVVLSSATTLTMLAGMLSMLQGPSFLQKLGCFVLSFACGFALYTIGEKGLQLGRRMHDPGSVAGAVALVLVLLLLTISCSSWFTATMIGGPASELAYRDDVLSKMERALDLRMAAYQSAAREFAPRLLKESLRFRLTSGLEASGHNTPRPGQGVVFDTELKIAEGYRNASEMTSTYLHSAHEVWASAKEAVRKTRSGIFDPAISRADADKAMQAVAATVSRQLAHMEDFDPLEVPQGLVHVMVQVPQRGITEVERQELQRLSVQTEELTVQLHEDAASARTSRPDVPRIEFRPLSPGETILAYASACPGAWVVPLSCDAFVALICLWTILAASDVRRRTRQQRVLAKRVFLDGNAPARLIPRHQMQPE